MMQVYKSFGLEPGTCEVIGHALAMHNDDSYMNLPAKVTYDRICDYVICLYANLKDELNCT